MYHYASILVKLNGGFVKRYAIFKYATFYPCGGWNDFICAFQSLEEAQKTINTENVSEDEKFLRSVDAGDHFQIVDLVTLEIIEGDDDPSGLKEIHNGKY